MAQRTVETGIAGLDSILHGGLPRGQLYLVEGAPGAGKTTLAMQFLLEGSRRGERGLYVTLSETRGELESVAASHGWGLDGITIQEVHHGLGATSGDDRYTVFHPSEVELAETTNRILALVEAERPSRVVIDPLSELRLLADELFRYRRELLRIKQFFLARDCTLLLLDDCPVRVGDSSSHTMVHGVIELEQVPLEYGAERRRLRVSKVRAASYTGGYHDFVIVRGGLTVFPRLVASEHRSEFEVAPVTSGMPGFDSLLGGGLDRGTTTLFTGPAGTGKSSAAMKIAIAAAERGERAAVFAFEEDLGIVLRRGRALSERLKEHMGSGRILFRHTDPAEMSPGEFASVVRDVVQRNEARVVVVDSLNGYLNAMPEERFLTAQLHELLGFLNNQGVVTVLVLALPGLVGTGGQPPLDVSYLTDVVVMFRHFESSGAIHTAVSVLKKRTGSHERTIRELRFSANGLAVGEALTEFRGVLTGVPMFTGEAVKLSGGDL